MVTLLLVAVTMIVSLTITPIVIAISKRLNLVDKPNFRKVHTKPISVMGGTVSFHFNRYLDWSSY